MSKRDNVPSEIVADSFEEWLDYCLIGAEEIGRSLGKHVKTDDKLYHRRLTPRQALIRNLCKAELAKKTTTSK